MMHVLLIEDDDTIAASIAAALSDADFVILRDREGEAGWAMGRRAEFTAIILDLSLPALDGLNILRRWREEGIRTPVLILTARGSWLERVQGIDAGADDYLPKPFHMEELVARLRALVRRATGLGAAVLRRGDLVVDARRKQVSACGRTISLTPQEFKALNYLVANCGRVVPVGELSDHVHGARDAVTANAVEAMIGRIRRKLGADLIETRRGFGYIVQDGSM